MEGTWGDVHLEEGLLRWLLNWRVKLAGRLGPCRPGLWDESVLTWETLFSPHHGIEGRDSGKLLAWMAFRTARVPAGADAGKENTDGGIGRSELES